MRRIFLLAALIAVAIGAGSVLVSTSAAAPAAQDAPERLVVFESLGREA
ncbi:MAG: hypothetical protein ACK2T6_02690 [Anaerolineae bacterium]|jgi:hypothetical protein